MTEPKWKTNKRKRELHKQNRIQDILNSLNGTYQEGSRTRMLTECGLKRLSKVHLDALWAMVVTTVDPVYKAKQ